MKKAHIVLSLLLTVLLTMTLLSCSAPDTGSVNDTPAETAATAVVTEPGSTASAGPSASEAAPTMTSTPERTYDFSNIEPPPRFTDQSGFINSQWGASLEDVFANEISGSDGDTAFGIVKHGQSFAGITFTAEFIFRSDESNDVKLVGGNYYQYYTDSFNSQSGIEKAVEDYNMLLAYLTELYGTPKSYMNANGSQIEVNGNINDFVEREAVLASTFWFAAEDGNWPKPLCILSLSSPGLLSIQFNPDLSLEA